jgi:hypothetical protein
VVRVAVVAKEGANVIDSRRRISCAPANLFYSVKLSLLFPKFLPIIRRVMYFIFRRNVSVGMIFAIISPGGYYD